MMDKTTAECSNCHAELEPGFDLCWKCGADVDGGPPPERFAHEVAELESFQAQLAKRREQHDGGNPPRDWASDARKARLAGQTVFQVDLPLSTTRGVAIPLTGAFAKTTPQDGSSHVIQDVEAEGWRLEHAGYVYRLTGSDSRQKVTMGGQEGAFSGEVVGIYLFRVAT